MHLRMLLKVYIKVETDAKSGSLKRECKSSIVHLVTNIKTINGF